MRIVCSLTSVMLSSGSTVKQSVDRSFDQPARVVLRLPKVVLETFLLRDVTRRGENTFELSVGRAERRCVVRHRRRLPRSGSHHELVVRDAILGEHLSNAVFGELRVGEILLEWRADERLAIGARHLAHLPVHVADDSERVGGHQRVDIRFDESAVVLLRLAQLSQDPLWLGEIVRNHREPDRNVCVVATQRDRDERRERRAIFADASQLARPFPGDAHVVEDRLGSPALHVVGAVKNERRRFADDIRGVVSVDAPRTIVPSEDHSVEILRDDRIFGRALKNRI